MCVSYATTMNSTFYKPCGVRLQSRTKQLSSHEIFETGNEYFYRLYNIFYSGCSPIPVPVAKLALRAS